MATNVKLLLEELRHLTIHPEQHDQSCWATATTQVEEGYGDVEPPRPSACGSFGCLAGNAVLHQGIGLYWYQYDRETEDGTVTVAWRANFTVENQKTPWGQQKVSISAKARELLDLTPTQGERLFDGGNSLESLWRIAEQITGGEISRWQYQLALRDRDNTQVTKA